MYGQYQLNFILAHNVASFNSHNFFYLILSNNNKENVTFMWEMASYTR